MNPEAINQAAQTASQVGLLTWVVTAVVIFCGVLILTVMYQGYRREERLAKLQETTLALLGDKMDSLKSEIKDAIKSAAQTASYQKDEHKSMIESLSKISATMVQLAVILKMDIPK